MLETPLTPSKTLSEGKKISVKFEDVVLGTIALQWLTYFGILLGLLCAVIVMRQYFPERLPPPPVPLTWRDDLFVLCLVFFVAAIWLWMARGVVMKRLLPMFSCLVLFSAYVGFGAIRSGNPLVYTTIATIAVGWAMAMRVLWRRIAHVFRRRR